jgi:hypothetical protein
MTAHEQALALLEKALVSAQRKADELRKAATFGAHERMATVGWLQDWALILTRLRPALAEAPATCGTCRHYDADTTGPDHEGYCNNLLTWHARTWFCADHQPTEAK